MFKNYLKIAARNLRKQKSFTFINVIGLSIGMTCFFLIFLYVRFELSYEGLYKNSDRIFRVALERKYPDRVRLWGRTPMPIATTFPQEYPEILKATRILTNNNSLTVSYGDKNIYDDRVFFADPNFFEVFSVPLIEGDPKSVLSKPNSVVLTEETAFRVFSGENPMGKTLTINNAGYTVTGISENIPPNSHFHYNFLLSFISVPAYNGQQWINAWGVFTYIVLQDNINAQAFEPKLNEMVLKYMAPEVLDEVQVSFEEFMASGNGYRFFLQPLKSIHLRSALEQEIEPNGSMTYVYLFSLISVFVLLIACINFMNLSTARSVNRAKEVGIRKTVGSNRRQIISQFLTESTILSFLALIISGIMVSLLIPLFRNMTRREIQFHLFENVWTIPLLLGFTLTVGLLAGSYPAFFLSAFKPVTILQGKLRRAGNSRLRNILVVFQFMISIVLIISTLVVNSQINFMLNKDLGYNKEHVVVVGNTQVLNRQFAAFKQELMRLSGVKGVTGSINFPGGAFDGNVHRPVGTTDDRAVSISAIFADLDYVDTMGMEIVKGRNFSRDFATDQNAYILNQTAAELLGLSDPVGKIITDHNQNYEIIGILKDFHFKSLHSVISPVAYRAIPENFANFASVRILSGNIAETLTEIEKTWSRFTEGRPFEYSFLDDDLAVQYDAEQKTKRISGIFTGMAVFIGCLGLLGLAAFTAEQRTKEIGIRKVVGASVFNLIFLLIKDFARLTALSFLFATPFAYFAMRKWLDNFAYSTNLRADPFLIAGFLSLFFALLTVSYQAVRAALRDPVESLKYE